MHAGASLCACVCLEQSLRTRFCALYIYILLLLSLNIHRHLYTHKHTFRKETNASVLPCKNFLVKTTACMHTHTLTHTNTKWGRIYNSVGTASDWKARCSTDADLTLVWHRIFLPIKCLAQWFIQPLCAIACLNTCVHVKHLNHQQPYHNFDSIRKCCTDTLVGMDGVVLVAAAAMPR